MAFVFQNGCDSLLMYLALYLRLRDQVQMAVALFTCRIVQFLLQKSDGIQMFSVYNTQEGQTGGCMSQAVAEPGIMLCESAVKKDL